MSQLPKFSMESLVAQACHFIDESTGGIVPPIQPSTTYVRNASYDLESGYGYSRDGNPTYCQVEKVAAMMDGGEDALVFSSGLAAAHAVIETVNMGEHIVAPQVMYHGTQDWLRRVSKKRNIGVSFFDATEPSALAQSVIPGKTTLVWIETPVNPTWDVIDINHAADVAHEAGATLVVDATVCPPVTTRALEHGADIVFHSATKYLNGHSDVIAGLLVTAKPDQRWDEINLVRKLAGGVPGPFESWLLLRGMRTLFLRFERASGSALKIATALESHPAIERVLYPGLKSHPGHTIAARQMVNGFGGMLSLLIKGDADHAKSIATSTRLFVPATSLGGVESLIEHRASVEGPYSKVPENLLRLSIGIENAEDLLADITQALNQK